MTNAIPIFQVLGDGRYGFGAPRISALLVLGVLWGCDNLVVHVLEGPAEGGRLRADVVCWVAGEGLGLISEAIACEFSLSVQAQIESALGCSIRYFAFWDGDSIFKNGEPLAVSVNVKIFERIFVNEVFVVADWVDACVRCL